MIKDPYIGMPIIIDDNWNDNGCCCGSQRPDRPGCGGDIGDDDQAVGDGTFDSMYLGALPLAMAYVPIQKWKTTYSPEKALQAGTVFPELDLPFRGGMTR